MVEIVSSQTAEQIKISDAANRIEHALKELLANLLRVQRGSGRDYEICHQVIECANAFIEYQNVGGSRWNLKERGMLDVDTYSPGSGEWTDYKMVQISEDAILSGAMQVIASRLLRQRSQEVAGSREMFQAIRDHEMYLTDWNRQQRAMSSHEILEEAKVLLSKKGKKAPAKEPNPYDRLFATNSPPTTPEQQANGDERAAPSTKGEGQ